MKRGIKILFWIFLMFLPSLIFAQKKEVIAYYPEWRAKDKNPYVVKDIVKSNSAGKITILNYAFAIPRPDSSGNIIAGFMDPYLAYQQVYSSDLSVDGVADDSTQPLRGQFNQLRKLKKKYPQLKIVLSIGGWTGSKYFSDMVKSKKSREHFINFCIKRFINGDLPKENNAGGEKVAAGIFDGFDIDWEFPVNGGEDKNHHDPNDNNNLTKFYELFRTRLSEINKDYLLTAAVPAMDKSARYYNIYEDQQYLDWYNIMTYDYHGGWDEVTGHNSNLLSSNVDTTFDRERDSFDKSIHLYNCIYGVSRSKIVPGVAFYGRGWKVADSTNNGLGVNGKETEGNVDRGFIYYSDLIKLQNKNYKTYWDKYAMAPYIYNPDKKIFWTFDNTESISLKVHYVDSYDLRGLMFWEISGDDSLGTLVNTIYTGSMPEPEISHKAISSQPEIKIVSPSSSDWINEGSNVVIYTESSDDNGTIVKVEFLGDGKSLGFNTNSPFNWVWFNIQNGRHTIKVIAFDNTGKRKASDPVRIFVKDR
jgi:chitinase